MNILLCTTVQWNCGDEFIRNGIIKIIKKVFGKCNLIIQNRNPDIAPKNFIKVPQFDNSIKEIKFNYSYIDLVIFCGTPEWQNSRCKKVYDLILENKIPCAFIGIGDSIKSFALPEQYKVVLNKSLKIICRQSTTSQDFKKIGIFSEVLPCPSILSSPYRKIINKVRKIGLVLQNTEGTQYQCVDTKTFNFQVELYKKIYELYNKKYEFKIIVHYIDEIYVAKQIFKNIEIAYSFDQKDYYSIYDDCDFIISPRVHGIGIATSLCIPSIAILHDSRGETTELFKALPLSYNTNINDALQLFEKSINSVNINNQILHNLVKDTYIKYISVFMKIKHQLEITKTIEYGVDIEKSNYFDIGSLESVFVDICKNSKNKFELKEIDGIWHLKAIHNSIDDSDVEFHFIKYIKYLILAKCCIGSKKTHYLKKKNNLTKIKKTRKIFFY